MKQTLRFEQISCKLEVDGLPDVSIGQVGAVVGIITGWRLQWPGRPELEGQKEHLIALMQTVLPYARRLISDAGRRIDSSTRPVAIAPIGPQQHQLELRSSQPDTPPLQVDLDDAELSDLVRVLDQLRLDPRLQLKLELPPDQPLRPRELQGRIPKRQRLAAPVAAVAALALSGAAAWLLPVPQKPQPRSNTPAKPTPVTTAPVQPLQIPDPLPPEREAPAPPQAPLNLAPPPTTTQATAPVAQPAPLPPVAPPPPP